MILYYILDDRSTNPQSTEYPIMNSVALYNGIINSKSFISSSLETVMEKKLL